MNKFQDNFKASLMALVMTGLIAGCGGGGSGSGDGGGGGGGDAASTDDPNWTVAPGAGTGVAGGGKGPAPVDLGTAGSFVMLGKSAISTVPGSAITGDVGLSPAAASFITGFSLSAPPSTFSTSTQVTGQVFAADYDPPTPINLGVSILNMEAAYTDANSRAPDYTELGTGDIGGMTLPPAVYKWGTGVLIPTDLVLSGGPNDVWIFQIAGDLTMASATRVTLAGGALASNIFWATFGIADVGTTAHFEGVLLSQTSITLRTGASANGRLLAQTAISLDQNVVAQP